MNPIPLGVYRHYKGNQYEVVGFTKHSETLEDMVIYKGSLQCGRRMGTSVFYVGESD